MISNRLYRLLVISFSISTFAEGILLPIYAVFVQQVGGDILDAAGAIATFYIVSGVATLFIHRFPWSQKHRIYLLTFGWLVWVLGIASYFIVSSVFTLFAAQVLVALGNAIADPAFDAELDDHTTTNYGWGIFEASKDVLNGLAAIAGGLVATFFGFKALIMCMIAAATISFVLILHYVHLRRTERPAPIQQS